ncbi:MAG: alpha/beta hydrolase [Acidobacteriia bacterium]|nr:alpha/beta hydrolase [Terriglobia bacterium]
MRDDYDPRLSIRGEGGAVILVPGMNGTGDLFYRQVPRLERSYRVATYSLRDDAENFDVLAADLARVVDIVAPAERRAIVVGESFGGAVALTFALAHPERIAALVILNSFPHFTPQFQLRLAIAGLAVLPWGAMSFVRRLTAFRLHSRHTHRAEVKQFVALTADATRDGYINRLKLLTRYDVRDRLHEIQLPTLFLASELDHLVPSVSQARYMADRVPSSVMRILQGHGHICLIAPDLDLERILHEWQDGSTV